ncbi:chromatin modification-related protein EAF1 B isoform X1 [Setaria italica]|uniref:Myb-like domain-containing protein n=1 Tax=Setaria italica TaxID=4555 RepID=K3Z329_SETIT|nr:chromatin modification-related protein EAF1 B isoform X1 [Setaria italica]
MVNAEPCSMGGIIDYGVGVGTKLSPRSLSIEKAQEELRQEFDVREERRRELEFLEKGGNPLDFKFVHVETVSVHSASLTNQTEAQNVISDAKGSFPASPYGDSVESTGKPGSSLCRETNTADNLMLLDGSNNGIAEEKFVKRGTKRLNAAQPKQSLPNDGHKNAKKPVVSGLSRLGDKSQAYVRRNRSKPSRESANVASVRSSIPPAKVYETKDENGVLRKSNGGDHGVLSVSSIKQSGSNCDNAPKNAASDGQAEMELDGIQAIHESECVVNEEAKQADNNSKAKEVSSTDANHNRLPVGCGEITAEVASAETPDTSLKVPRPCYPSASTHDERESCPVDEKADYGHLDEHMAHIHAGQPDSRRKVLVCAVEASTSLKNAVGPPCEGPMNIVDNHSDGDTNLVAAKIDVKSHEDLDSSRCYSAKESSDLVQPEANNILHMKDEMEICDSATVAQKDTGCLSSGQTMNIEESPASDRKNSCVGDLKSAHPISDGTDLPKALPSPKYGESNLENELKKSKAYEDSVLKEAHVIEASIKRAGERSHCNIALEKRSKSHWDFVLEEMAWMANDFMQERLWKSVAAAKVCHWIASDGRGKFEEASIQRKQKAVMKIIAKGITSFWRSAEALQTADTAKMMQAHNSTMLEETQPSGTKAEKEHVYKSLEAKESRQPRQSQILGYAVRFLEYNSRVADSHVLPEAPPTPERLNDFGILKVSDHLSEESLFYTVAPGLMLAYRESLESLSVYHKFQEVGNAELNDDYEASVCDSAAVCSDLLWENAYEEDEGETCTYLSPKAYDGGCLSNMGHKKKHQMQQRISILRPYEIGTDMPYEPCLESKSGNQPLLSNGKRPTSFLAIPPKRIRTAVRQRVVSPFHAGATGPTQVTSKTDASSGDTNSYQDDQSSLHGPWRNTDFESTVDSDRQLPYDASEVCTKANKKKKFKKPGYKIAQNTINSSVPTSVKFQGRMYDPRLQVDLTNKYEQKEYLKKRSDVHRYDSNGNSVAYGGQHAPKKLKMVKQGIDISQEASPARFINFIANRDRGRKCKSLKMTSGGWSSFEDQALVVLVHDMGQNWELVSDAINSIVQFKSVHRKPKECKERHKVLVDRSSGDGADSAEDSGSSQYYHNALPGIPKGSARQLFERLQGPNDEENLKAHFEKIILLMQQVHARRRQGNRQELKQIMQPHSSQVIALSQACPNRVSGGTLMPLDLCDVTSPNLDSITPGSVYPGSHTNGITLPNHHHQGSVGPSIPTSNLNSRLPGSPGLVLGSNSPSPSTLNTPRDAQKYGVPRPTLQGDEQLKIQFNQMVNGRNIQQPGGPVPGAFPAGVDRGAHMMPAAHGMGTVAGLNRGMPAAKPGFPRINSPAMLNTVSSGNMLPNSGQGVPNAVSVHTGAISGPGNSILRVRDPMQTLRPVQGMEEHRQMPEFDMQVAQGSSQATVQFSSMNPSFSSVAASPVQLPQQPHQMSQSLHMFGNSHPSQIQGTTSSPQHQAYALAKERQMQQRMAPQQHSDVFGATAVPNVQNSTQILQQNQASAADSVPCSQPQHQRRQTAQKVPDSSSSPNQPASTTQQKQKKQQGQQQSRQNQQQRNQGSQQAKLMKSLGRGNMLMPQTPIDSTPANAASTPPKKHVPEKLVQHGQGVFPANTVPTPSTPQPGNQPKLVTSLPQSPKKVQDIGNQGLMQGSLSQTLLATQQAPLPSKSTLTTQLQQRQINPSQNSIERAMVQQNRQMNSDCRTDLHIDQVQHNQMVPTSLPQSADSGSPVVPLVNPQKQEVSHNPASVTPSSKLLTSPKDPSLGNETLSSQELLQRQVSGGFPIHGHGVVGQWNQQARQLLQSQHQQRPVVQGSVYTPSNSGPG